ncbi:MAG: hypothetical protein K2X27_07240 [Candidatus Obscuribacterales bacterium]|nr:hypothetical protein [Candidatus Obscuribacterales bacterium]
MNDETVSSGLSKTQTLFFWLSAATAGLCACIYLANWLAALSSPYSIAFESPMLWTAHALGQGQNIYALERLSKEPWLVTIYPPIYLCFAAILVKVLGVQYFWLRLANMILSVGVGALLFRIMRLSGSSLAPCICALTFFFSFGRIAGESYSARPDFLLLFLSTLMLERFLLVFTNEEKKNTFSNYLPVLILALAAIFTKQQAIVFVVSIAIFLCQSGKAKLAGKFMLLWLLGMGLISYILDLSCGGYFAHLSFLAATKSDSAVLLSNLSSLGVDWLKLFWALPVVPLAVLAIKKLDGVKSLPFILVSVSTGLFLYSMGIPASSTNHMMSAILGLSWCLSICLSRLPAWLGIIGLITIAASFNHLADEAIYRPKLLPIARSDAAKLLKMDLSCKPVLTDDLYLNVLTGSNPVIVDCATFMNVWTARGSGLEPLLKAISEKRYAAVIINSNDSRSSGASAWWPQALIDAVRSNYHKVAELQCSGWSLDLFIADLDH